MDDSLPVAGADSEAGSGCPHVMGAQWGACPAAPPGDCPQMVRGAVEVLPPPLPPCSSSPSLQGHARALSREVRKRETPGCQSVGS